MSRLIDRRRAMIRETIALAIGAAIFAGAFSAFLWVIL